MTPPRSPALHQKPGERLVKWTQHAVFLAGHILLDVCRYDHVTQIIDENHVHISVG